MDSTQINALLQGLVGTSPNVAVETTKLDPVEEANFRKWYAKYSKVTGNAPNPDDPEHYYDYRGFYRSDGGASLLAPDMHLPDTYKLPGHPTFSDESKYAVGKYKSLAGHWDSKGNYIPPKKKFLSQNPILSGLIK